MKLNHAAHYARRRETRTWLDHAEAWWRRSAWGVVFVIAGLVLGALVAMP